MSCRHKPSNLLLVYNKQVFNKVCYRSVIDVLYYGIRCSYSVCPTNWSSGCQLYLPTVLIIGKV